MALLLISPLSSVSSSSSLSKAVIISPIFRLQKKCVDLQPKSVNGMCICTPFGLRDRGAVVVRVSSGTDGMDPSGDEPPAEDEEEDVAVENLPLESKLQLKLEQKLRMKLAKKIRLRRRKLVRKRRMRKKGRWPPSKMKKNKNV